jgi:hypothetical protein
MRQDKKMAPEIGAISLEVCCEPQRFSSLLEPEMGEVTVSRRDAGAAQEQAVDGGQQAAEHAGAWSESGGFRHFYPFAGMQRSAATWR